MPTTKRLRGKLSAVIPRDEWRELLVQRFFRPTDFPRTVDNKWAAAISQNDLRKVASIEIFLAKIVCLR